jgi:predicted permease
MTLRNALVVCQVVLSLVVMVCAGLFVKSFQNARDIDPGFSRENILMMTLMPGLLGYDNMRGREFYHQLIERVSTSPGVEGASLTHRVPLGDSWDSDGPAVAEGQPIPPPGRGLSVGYTVVSPGYFGSMQTPLLRGRDFSESDRTGNPRVAIINETAAQRLWPNADPVGRRLSLGRTNPVLYQVIGVARDGKYISLSEPPRAFLWFPLGQFYEQRMTLLVRTTGESQKVIGSVREAVKTLEPNLPLASVMTMNQHLTWALWAPQMGALVSTAFSILAMLLAMLGIYSIIAYAVNQQTKEIGIRLALGAQSRSIVAYIAVQGMKLVLTGVLIGLALAFAFTRLLASLLYGVSVIDPLIFASAIVILISIGFLASYLPARRATKVDPLVALRRE